MGLRKAGQSLIDTIVNAETAYADRSRKDAYERGDRSTAILGGTPLFEKAEYTPVDRIKEDMKETLGREARGYEVLGIQAGERALVGGIKAVNAGYRYGLPAAGVTLAGKGLIDLTAQFGNAADQPEQGQLPLT